MRIMRAGLLSVVLVVLSCFTAAGAANWFSLYLEGQKVGYSYSSSLPISEGEYAGGVWMESYSTMQLVRDGRSLITTSRRRELYSAEGVLIRAVDHRMSGAEAEMVEAELVDGVLEVRRVQGVIIGKRYLEGGLVGTLGSGFATAGVEPGERLEYRCYDSGYSEVIEASLERGELEELTLDGRTFMGYHNVTTFAGVSRDIYLEADGSLVVVKVPGGMEVRPAASEEEAKADVGWVDPTASAAIFPTGGRLGEPRTARRLVTIVQAESAPPEGPFQRVEELEPGRWRVEFVDHSESTPHPGAVEQPEFKGELNRLTERLRDPEDEYNTLAALREWVSDNLDNSPLGLELTPSEIYARRYGDCSEHAALLTDLARRAGLHARTVVGLVYGEGDAFYYHAWNEVYADGRWRLVDAFLEQLPADAARIALAYDPGPAERTAFFGGVESVELVEAE